MGPENTNEPMPTMPPVSGERSVGPAIGIIVIIAVIVLGGLYFWGQRAEREKATPAQTEATTSNQTSQTSGADADIQAMNTQSSSDDVSSIEADLNSTNLSSLGSETTSINAAAAATGATP